jgi:TolB protein
MMPRLAMLLLVAAVIPGGESTGADSPASPVIKRVAVRPLTGSTGETVTRVLLSDLEHAGTLEMTNATRGAYIASGEASGGWIEGRLSDPAGQELMRVLYESLNLKHSAHQFADDIIFTITHTPGTATSVIAFVSDVSGQKKVYLCDCDGADVRLVTKGAGPAVNPSIARDAAFLTYTGYQSGYADVYFVDLVTGNQRRVVSGPGTNGGAAISPDGRRLALTMSRSGKVELAVTTTAGRAQVPNLPTDIGLPVSPAWSPDGKVLALAIDRGSGPQIGLLTVGDRTVRMIPTGFRHCVEPDWSPDSQRLVFVARENGENGIALYNLAAGGRARLIARGESPTWGADGRHIVYSTGSALVIHDVDSGQRRTILSNMGHVTEPTWTK